MRARTLIAAAAACLWGAPALACTLTIASGGTLALSPDGLRFGSGESGGTPASFTVLNLSLGAATITVSPPQIVDAPAGFNTGTAVTQVAYSGSGVLGSVNQPYTSAQTQFQVPGLLSLALLMTVHNRIVSNAFVTGSYSTRTMVTCS